MKNFWDKYKLKIILIVIVVLISSTGIYFSGTSKSNYKKKIPKIEENKQYEVVKVIDGDTFKVQIDKQVITVRMLGIDTPETVDPRKTVQCFGYEASNMTKSLLIGHSVALQTDSSQSVIDKYGRVLAYIYRYDGLFINSYLIENGYAHEYTYNIPYQKMDEFKSLEKKAREEKKGLWGDLCLPSLKK